MDQFTGGCLAVTSELWQSDSHIESAFVTALTAANIMGPSLDASNQLVPTHENWIIRCESWLPPFPVTRRYECDLPTTKVS